MLFSELVLYFFIYSVIGWMWETLYCSLSDGHYVARGFLYGPYCPVYGFGVLLLLYLVHPYITKNVFVLFLASAFIVTALEYYTGFALEKFLNLKLWDYSKYFLNIHGRICLPVTIFWGVCCVLIVKVVNPKVAEGINYLYLRFGGSLALLIAAFMLSDFVLSVIKVVKHNR